nr:hypothetical protein [uncultured Enterobacter sp.]
MQKSSPSDRAEKPVNESHFWLTFEARARQFGLLLLLLIVIAAVSGVFSRGVFSHVERTQGSLSLSYERFGRQLSDTEMKIVIPKSISGDITLTLGGDFMRTFQLETLQPQPDSMSTEGDNLLITYKRTAIPADRTLWLNLLPLTAGRAQNWVQVDQQPALRFWQFIYP